MELDTAIRKLFKGSAVVLAGTVFELLISFFGKVLIARYLGPTAFGAVSIGVAFLSFGSTVLLLGIDTGLTRFLPRFDDTGKQRRLIAEGLLTGLALPIIVGGLVALGADFVANSLLHAPESADILRLFAVTIPFAGFVYLTLGITRGMKLSIPQIIIQNVTLPIVRLGTIAVALYLGLSTLGFSLAYALPFIFASVIAAVYLRRSPLFDEGWATNSMARELVYFSIPLSISAIAIRILSDVDTFILSYFHPTDVVGLYGVVYPLAVLVSTGNTAAGFMFMPLLSEQHAAGREADMRRIYQVGTKWIILATVPVVFLFSLFPGAVIQLTFGAEYTAGSTALAILALGFFVDAAFGLNAETLTSLGRIRWVALSSSAAAVANFLLNVALVPGFGIVGAAWATTLCLFLMNALLSWKLYDLQGMHVFSRPLVRVLTVSTVLFGSYYALVTRLLSGSLTTIAVGFGITAILYGVTVLRFGGIEAEEVMIIQSIEERFGVDFGPIKRILKYFMND